MPYRETTILCLLLAAWAAVAQQTVPIPPDTTKAVVPPPVELAAPATVLPEVADRTLKADEAAQIALKYHYSIAMARAGVQAAEGRYGAARAGLLPSVTVGSGYTNVTGGSGAAQGTGSRISADAKQLLFDSHHTRDLVSQAQAQAKGADAGLDRAQCDLVYQVKQAFYNYTQALQLVKVNEENLTNRQAHLDLANARLEAGVGLPVDVARAETAVANAVLNLTIARTNALVARTALAQLMGLDPRTPLQVADSVEPAPGTDDLQALLEQAMARRPEIHQAQQTIDANQYGVNAARNANAPSVSSTLGWGDRGSGLLPDTSTVSLGFAVAWNAYDSGLTKNRVQEAQANLQTAQAQLTNTSLTVMSDVSQSYLALKTAEQRIIAADVEVKNARESLNLAQGRWQAGVGQYIDVQDAQTALVTATTNRVNAETARNQARAALAHATSTDPVYASSM